MIFFPMDMALKQSRLEALSWPIFTVLKNTKNAQKLDQFTVPKLKTVSKQYLVEMKRNFC
jgi:hypothetical protein